MAAKQNRIIIGVGSHAVALDPTTGMELWRTKLKSSSFVTIAVDGDRVFAGAAGEIFCLEAYNGNILWHNKLKGLGMGLVTFTGDDAAAHAAAEAQRRAAAAAAT